jgi:predicted RNA binding protein YcfA (HicA-like mRNA interferase family)
MKVRILKQLLTQAGFRFIRPGKGDHEIWGNDEGLRFPVDGSDGWEVPLGTLNSILRITGLRIETKSKGSKK